MVDKKIKKEKPKIETTVPVYNFLDAKELRKADLPKDVFDGQVNKALLHQVVIMYQANQREGTASTKTRGEVSGGGKKPWRQKGTGRARVGSSRNPIWKGGGAVFGPHPRDYSYSLPKKIKRLAVKSALNGKLLDSELFLIDEFKMPQPKTKIFAAALKNFLKHNAKVKKAEPHQMSAMFVTDEPDTDLKRATRNIKHVLVENANNFSALDIMLHKNLILSETALKKICKRIS